MTWGVMMRTTWFENWHWTIVKHWSRPRSNHREIMPSLSCGCSRDSQIFWQTKNFCTLILDEICIHDYNRIVDDNGNWQKNKDLVKNISSNRFLVFSKYICITYICQHPSILVNWNAFVGAWMHAAIKFLQRQVCCICRLVSCTLHSWQIARWVCCICRLHFGLLDSCNALSTVALLHKSAQITMHTLHNA